MKFNSQITKISQVSADCLAVPVYQSRFADNPHLKLFPKALKDHIQALFKGDVITGREGDGYLLRVGGTHGFEYLYLAGIGKKEDLEHDSIRRFGGNLASSLKGKKFKELAICVPESFQLDDDCSLVSQMAVEGLLLGSYELLKYKSEPSKKAMPARVSFILPDSWDKRRFNAGLKIGEIMAWGQNLSRDLIGHPSNYLTPVELANTARSMARTYGFKCEVLNKARMKKLRMNCILAVNSGSKEPPQFIIMHYKGVGSKKDPVCLVGKGITFDSGGISLKKAQDMDQMKGDMGGAACVLASVAVAARLKLPVNLVGLIPATENLPSGSAYKPGDILTAMNGKTIEVLNTDAEGRLVLADALSYSQRLKPAAIIDVATLTGASMVALGYVSSAMFTNDDKLRKLIMSGSQKSSEKTWEMPLWKEYQEQIKSSIADIKNTGGRPAGSCTAAAFLNNFTADYPWAHLDIAAVDVVFEKGPYNPKGASGYGVRLISEFLREWK
ncbi:MAG TPA: leucyl aminopeptidase [candidate division Zixibacteria bacterium]|nr:leucyl aminopeptidase [candidate division Zixibacteria bacterium]HEQ99001.1 leucyl aminopeptidase [candidate division Zixibacteria bacterium]